MLSKIIKFLILCIPLLLSGLLYAAPSGTLDNSFSADGKLITTIGSEFSVAESVIQLRNGKLMAVGRSKDFLANEQIALVSYLANGVRDSSFGAGGIVTTRIGPGNTNAFAALQLSNGSVVVAGSSFNVTNDDFTLVSYTTDGLLDTSFNGTGTAVTPVGFEDDGAFALIQDSLTTLIAAGYSSNQGNDDFALVSYNLNGTVNTSFGDDGKVTTDFGNQGDDVITALIRQKDGKLVAAGYSNNGTNDEFAVARYNSDGSPDTSFSNDGRVRISFGSGQDQALSILQQTDGKLVVAGFSFSNGKNVIAVARLNANGTLDTTFSKDGKARIAAPSNSLDAKAYKVLQLFDGKILIAGYNQTSAEDFNFLLVRYRTDGIVDDTFSGDGKLSTNFGNTQTPGVDQAFAAIQLNNDNIVLAGTSDSSGTPSIALARYRFDDEDDDGVKNKVDNCPIDANTDQANADGDDEGDVCDPDDDNDGVPDSKDSCPFDPSDSVDTDNDRICNNNDDDDDNDGVLDAVDPSPLIGIIGIRANDFLGYSVANGGDIDGDGFDDIIVGSPKSNPVPAGGSKPVVDAGTVIVFSGKTALPISGLTFNGDRSGDEFGSAVSGSVDVNNDSVPDIIAGAPKADLFDPANARKLKKNTGRIAVFSGSNGTLLFDVYGEESGDGLGVSVLGIADTNADGFAEVLAGAWKADVIGNDGKKLSNAGAAYLFSGRNHTQLHKFTGEAKGDLFGFSLASGDVNGDARPDLMFGAYRYDSIPASGKKRANSGAVYVYSGADYTLLRRLDGTRVGDRFGFAVAGIADINGDGRADIVVGAPKEDTPHPVTQKAVKNAGNVHLYSGSDGTLLDTTEPGKFINDNPQIEAGFGSSISSAGDFNKDSIADFVVGAYRYDAIDNGTKVVNAGKISVHSGDSGSVLLSMNGHSSKSFYSFAVAGGGDHNGDGFSDILVGAHKADPFRPSTTTPITNAGNVEVVSGKAITNP